MSRPLISVIMAAYNAERFVGEAVRSIQEQTYTNWEMICVDDCSTDGTYEILRSLAHGDSRMTVLNNETNMGAALTRNRAIHEAQGDLIAIQDADDISMSYRLAESLGLLGDSDVVGSDAYTIDQESRRIGYYRTGWDPDRYSALDWLMRGKHLYLHSTMLLRRLALPTPPYNDLPPMEDYDTKLRMAVAGAVFVKGKRPLAMGRSIREAREGKMTTQRAFEGYFAKLAAQQAAMCALAGEPFSYDLCITQLQQDPTHVAAAHLRAGWIALREGAVYSARGHLAEAVRARETRRAAIVLRVVAYCPSPLRETLTELLYTTAQGSHRSHFTIDRDTGGTRR